MRVLLIEPDYLLAKVYCRSLELAGHIVDRQSSGQDAILAADLQAPDIVVLEFQLYGHSGVEFLYEFRSYVEWQPVPVIVHSFMPDWLTATQKQQLGITTYLYKPTTSLVKLRETVGQFTSAVL